MSRSQTNNEFRERTAVYFSTSHMKLMRCFNLIIIKITSLFSYLAEFDWVACDRMYGVPVVITFPKERGDGQCPGLLVTLLHLGLMLVHLTHRVHYSGSRKNSNRKPANVIGEEKMFEIQVKELERNRESSPNFS